MANADVGIVKSLVYENLGISNGYGTLLTNARYPTDYIDDRIIEADIITTMILAKNKQNTLLTSTSSQTLATGSAISSNWLVLSVQIGSGLGVEIPIGQYEALNLAATVFDVVSYGRYFAFFNGKIFHYGGSMSPAETATINYIDLSHPASLSALKAPTGFEGAIANLASANLLMKRGDKPDQAAYYKGLYTEFMQQYMIPEDASQIMETI